MQSIDTELATRIRNDIIHGQYAEGERLSESHLCKTHDVSRTPVRLALRLLEREGVVRRGDGRGYVIQTPTIEGVKQAVQVRGHLESLGARLMAQAPDRHAHLPAMAEAIDIIEAAIDGGTLDEGVIRGMQAANRTFHATILGACGNDYIGFTCQQISHLPMLAAGSMVFDRSVSETPEQLERGLFRLRLGNAQHRVIHAAIADGDCVRAEGMMREHANTMIEYIETFEKRDGSLTVADLVAYSAAGADLSGG
ncbi:MAG: GntR family transcriptional regulator [Pseudomonadota bacterium]